MKLKPVLELLAARLQTLGRRQLLSLATFLLLLLALPLGVVLVQQEQETRSRAQEVKAEKLSNQLLVALANWQAGASISRQEVAFEDLGRLTEERKTLLVAQARQDPAAFLRQATLAEKRDEFPAEIQKNIEEEKELQGKIVTIHLDDFQNQKSQFDYKLKVGDRHLNLRFAKDPPVLLTDTEIKVKGILLDQEFVVESGKILESSKEGGISLLGQPAISVAGEQKTLVFLVNFQNDTSQPIDQATVSDILFGGAASVNRYYQENSFGQVYFAGDIVGWYTIPYSSSNCTSDYWAWADAARLAALQQGVDLAQYPRHVLIFARPADCPWGGLGTLGGNPSTAWILDFWWVNPIYSHEIGHNLGTHHANSLSCGPLTIDDYVNCSLIEYGDYFDVMGNFWYVNQAQIHFNGPHKASVGWVVPGRIKEVTADGTYTLVPLETPATGFQVLKILKSDTNQFYYLDWRRPVGFDVSLPAGISGGASLYIWDEVWWHQTWRLDTTPFSPDGIRDSSFADGTTFLDQKNGISITQLGHDENSVTLQIDLGEQPTPTPTSSPSPTPTPTLTPTPSPTPTPTVTPTPTPTPSPTPTPKQTPTPSPTPSLNNPPEIITRSLPQGRAGQSYRATVGAVDKDKNETLVMSIDGLPDGLNPGKCTILKKRDQRGISCLVRGKPKKAGSYSVQVEVKDKQEAAAVKLFELVIRKK